MWIICRFFGNPSLKIFCYSYTLLKAVVSSTLRLKSKEDNYPFCQCIVEQKERKPGVLRVTSHIDYYFKKGEKWVGEGSKPPSSISQPMSAFVGLPLHPLLADVSICPHPSSRLVRFIGNFSLYLNDQ